MKVDFYIAGIQKSGTTNLAYLLSQSSNIVSHPQMECTFYWNPNEYNKGVKFLRNYYFFNTNDETLNHHFVLLKHSNSFTNVQILQKILKDNPNVHFLLVFRNPVQRYVSSYLMEKTRSLYNKTLEESIQIALKDKNSFEYKVLLKYGEYDYWYQKILGSIPDKSIHLFLFEELYDDKEHHLRQFAQKYDLNFQPEIIQKLQVKNSYKEFKTHWYQRMIRRMRHSKLKQVIKQMVPVKHWVNITYQLEQFNLIEPLEKPSIDKASETILTEYYAKHIEQFESLAGIKTNWLIVEKISTNER